jgi:SAM-dependent methyltransferase
VFIGTTTWRQTFMAAGFPLSLLASGIASGVMAVGWLVAALLLLLLYPLRSWRDAPVFPTPFGALDGLSQHITLATGARILDAGCGLGAGLIALRRAFPSARLEGLDWSWPLVIACRLRCRDAAVRRADIWHADWSAQDLVYLFQRPESMGRAVDKARRELRPGAWLVSLEFPALGLLPDARLEAVAGKPVWAYRAPFTSAGPTLTD